MEEAAREEEEAVAPAIFITRPLSIDPRSVVGEAFAVRVFGGERAPSRQAMIAGASGCVAIASLVSDAIDAALLDALPSVRHVAQVAVGYDNVDVEACRARGVLVTHTPGVLTDATADLTMTLVLAAARRVREGEALVREGRFEGWGPTMLLGMELSGRTLGVFGFGRIGRAVAHRARAFGMRVIYCSRSAVEGEDAQRVSFEALLRESDVLSVHAPSSPATRHTFDRAALMSMKPGAILVNTARGPLIEESALAEALDSGPLFRVALDVYENEPRVHPSLLARHDVVLLPHLGSATEAARARMATTALEDAVRVVRGEPARFVVPELGGAAPAQRD